MSEKLVSGKRSEQQDNNYQALSALRNSFDPAVALRLRQEKQSAKSKETIESLKDFYDALENPIDNDETLLSIIDAYAKEDKSGGLYGSLQEVGIEQKVTGLINTADKQRFEEKMYGRWGHSVAGMKEKEFLSAKAKGILDDNFILLHNFVVKHPECSTNSELRTTICQIPDKNTSQRMLNILAEYNWEQLDSWRHIESRCVNALQEDSIDINHRFYLKTDSTSTHAVIDALVDCYEKNHLPYYFKYDEPGHRADTIVIYTSTKDLIRNLNVLRQLKKEYPDLAEHFHQPPVLTGVIDGDIGYGAEPEKGSYSSVRAKLLAGILKSTTVDWVAAHQNDIISYGGKRMSFSDYVIESEIRKLKHDYSGRFSSSLVFEKQLQQSREGRINETEAIGNVSKKLGFNQQDLQDNSKMFSYIRDQLRKSFPAMISSFQNTGGYNLEISWRHKEKLQIGDREFIITLERIAPQIARHDKTYLEEIRKKVREACTEKGIDPDKFVFDTSTIAKMKKQHHLDKSTK